MRLASRKLNACAGVTHLNACLDIDRYRLPWLKSHNYLRNAMQHLNSAFANIIHLHRQFLLLYFKITYYCKSLTGQR